jgi:hypothetical protein
LNHPIRITSLAFASALAWTAAAAEPAGSSSDTSSTSSTSLSQPPVGADSASTSSGDNNATAKAEKPMAFPLHEIEGNCVWGITTKSEF